MLFSAIAQAAENFAVRARVERHDAWELLNAILESHQVGEKQEVAIGLIQNALDKAAGSDAAEGGFR